MSQTAQTPDHHAAPAPAGPRPAPFARLRIGPWGYEVGDCAPGGQLYARAGAEGAWTPLERRLDDGWHRIAAAILMTEPDLLTRFLQTHMVRVSGDFARGEVVHFDTLGTGWALRLEGDALFVHFGDEPWQAVQLAPGAPREGREWAVAALLAARFDLDGHFRAQMAEWAQRIAAGATVTPIL